MSYHAKLIAMALFAAAGAVQGSEPQASLGLRALNDSELRAVNRPLPWRMPAAASNASAFAPRFNAFLYAPGEPRTEKLRALNLLTADIEIKDVAYHNTQDWSAMRDGSYNVPLPSSIGEIDIRNIRCGPNDGRSLGSVQIMGIDLQNTTITVSHGR